MTFEGGLLVVFWLTVLRQKVFKLCFHLKDLTKNVRLILEDVNTNGLTKAFKPLEEHLSLLGVNRIIVVLVILHVIFRLFLWSEKDNQKTMYILSVKISCTFRQSKYHVHFVSQNIMYISSVKISCTFRQSKYHVHFVSQNIMYISSVKISCTFRQSKYHVHFVSQNIMYILSVKISCTFRQSKYHVHFVSQNIMYISSVKISCTFRQSKYHVHFVSQNIMYISSVKIRGDSFLQGAFHNCSAQHLWTGTFEWLKDLRNYEFHHIVFLFRRKFYWNTLIAWKEIIEDRYCSQYKQHSSFRYSKTPYSKQQSIYCMC